MEAYFTIIGLIPPAVVLAVIINWILGKLAIPTAGYTHYAKFCGIPAYWNDRTGEMAGRNEIYDFLIQHIAMPLQQSIIMMLGLIDPLREPMFMIDVGGQLPPDPEEEEYKDNTDY